MSSEIRYAQTRDGKRIAYCDRGEGLPIIHLTPFGAGSLEFERLPSTMRYMYGILQDRHRLIRFDPRGTGQSDRDVEEFTLEALCLDIHAVAEAAGLGRFAIFATTSSGPVAIAYAAAHPQRVSHLLLWCSSARGTDLRSPSRRAIDAIAQEDWKLYTEALASSAFGFAEAEDAARLAEILRDHTTPEMRKAFYGTIEAQDVTPLLSRVRMPVLVMHMRDSPLVPASGAARLAANLPDAKLVYFEGHSLFPLHAELLRSMQTMDRFLGGDGQIPSPAELSGAPA